LGVCGGRPAQLSSKCLTKKTSSSNRNRANRSKYNRLPSKRHNRDSSSRSKATTINLTDT